LPVVEAIIPSQLGILQISPYSFTFRIRLWLFFRGSWGSRR